MRQTTACTAAHGSRASTTRMVLIFSLALVVGVGGTTPAEELKPARADRYGDPLPPGALMRLGTIRFRHGAPIKAAAYSPDGKTLATAGQGGTIRLWDAATGKQIAVFQREERTASIASLAFSPDGKTLAAAGTFGRSATTLKDLPAELVCWDVAKGEARLSIPAAHDAINHQWSFHCLAYSPDGKWLADGTYDGVGIWDAATGKESKYLESKVTKTALAFSPDGKTLAWAGVGSDPVLWDVDSGKELRKLQGHKSWARDLAFRPDGKLLAACYNDATVGLWDPATGVEVRRLKGHEWGVESVAFSPDGKTLASAGACEEPISLWDPDTGEVRLRLQGPKAPNRVSKVLFSPDGKTLAAAYFDGTVFLWDPATGKRIAATDEHELSIDGVAVSPDGRTIATASRDGTVRLWDRATGRCLHTLDCGAPAWMVAFSPDGARLTAITVRWIRGAVLTRECRVRTWEAASAREVPAPHGEGDSLVFLLDSRLIAALRPDGALSMREATTGKELQQFREAGKRIDFVSLSPDGKTLAVTNRPEAENHRPKEGPTVHLWDVATGRETIQFGDVHTALATFSPDGRIVGTVEEGRVRLWDPATGVEISKIEHPEIEYFAFSPDSRTLATSSFNDSGIRLWEIASGQERLSLPGNVGGSGCLAFTPDGRTLISAGTDTTALVWDLAPPEPAMKDLDHLWSDLADGDASRAYRAVWALTAAPGAVDFLKAHLKPASGAEAKEIRRLIADLDSDDFEARERASKDLAGTGQAARDGLLNALAGKPSPEAERRIRELLRALRLHPRPPSDEELRQPRAVEVLERGGTAEGRQVLETLAAGGESPLTREAKAALARISRGAK